METSVLDSAALLSCFRPVGIEAFSLVLILFDALLPRLELSWSTAFADEGGIQQSSDRNRLGLCFLRGFDAAVEVGDSAMGDGFPFSES